VLSKALLKPEITNKQLKHVIFDTGVFFLFAVLLVFAGAALEVYIFPLF
jgi:hypothetical protein